MHLKQNIYPTLSANCATTLLRSSSGMQILPTVLSLGVSATRPPLLWLTIYCRWARSLKVTSCSQTVSSTKSRCEYIVAISVEIKSQWGVEVSLYVCVIFAVYTTKYHVHCYRMTHVLRPRPPCLPFVTLTWSWSNDGWMTATIHAQRVNTLLVYNRAAC